MQHRSVSWVVNPLSLLLGQTSSREANAMVWVLCILTTRLLCLLPCRTDSTTPETHMDTELKNEVQSKLSETKSDFFSRDGNRRREQDSFQEVVIFCILCGALSRSQSVISFAHHMVQLPLLADMRSFTSLSNYQKNKDAIGKYCYSWNISLSLG